MYGRHINCDTRIRYIENKARARLSLTRVRHKCPDTNIKAIILFSVDGGRQIKARKPRRLPRCARKTPWKSFQTTPLLVPATDGPTPAWEHHESHRRELPASQTLPRHSKRNGGQSKENTQPKSAPAFREAQGLPKPGLRPLPPPPWANPHEPHRECLRGRMTLASFCVSVHFFSARNVAVVVFLVLSRFFVFLCLLYPLLKGEDGLLEKKAGTGRYT